ncbi:thiamine-monophosphate kinase [Candidatus Rickettsiella viridis]|uniref:Thiamine-monophosphate kinase n=1 Tax=Candidatus Rickettsiella viridis TaxID=676208 RepID=A0A2Z5UTY4_9COXI|nr:thiamine-phosphate kinase [Candidatus Rickettsiella viridis]BBB14928.1 thiamine-monophosphate kinase [Candidatus Rickettsiella viridis]
MLSISEFDLIQRFFNQEKNNRADVIHGIGDDAAVLQPPVGQQLVVTTDTLVAGQHFPENTSPFDIGYKSLAVNLSDLAAMGAEPVWILLVLSLPMVDKAWLSEFTQGFFSLMHRFQCQLVGGDLTRGPLSITVQALGLIPNGKALLRSGAQTGDRIYVTGTLGDAGLALADLQNKINVLTLAQRSVVLTHLNRPDPRVAIGLALRDIANSAIDISDGLAADLGHILAASHVGAVVDITKLPISDALLALPLEKAQQLALSAGDDYELCFTVPEAHESALKQALEKIACPYTAIGFITKESGLLLQDENGKSFQLEKQGFLHF